MEPNEYILEDIAEDHPIGAALFVPFAVQRLACGPDEHASLITVALRGIMGQDESLRVLRLSWVAGDRSLQMPAVQERVVTEWGACGVACAVLRRYTGMRVRSVVADGDRFDYWVDDGVNEYALEVSGTTTDDLEQRHREKVRQLRRNPYGVDGYVVVVGFVTRRVILSFNRFEEDRR